MDVLKACLMIWDYFGSIFFDHKLPAWYFFIMFFYELDKIRIVFEDLITAPTKNFMKQEPPFIVFLWSSLV